MPIDFIGTPDQDTGLIPPGRYSDEYRSLLLTAVYEQLRAGATIGLEVARISNAFPHLSTVELRYGVERLAALDAQIAAAEDESVIGRAAGVATRMSGHKRGLVKAREQLVHDLTHDDGSAGA